MEMFLFIFVIFLDSYFIIFRIKKPHEDELKERLKLFLRIIPVLLVLYGASIYYFIDGQIGAGIFLILLSVWLYTFYL